MWLKPFVRKLAHVCATFNPFHSKKVAKVHQKSSWHSNELIGMAPYESSFNSPHKIQCFKAVEG